MWWHRAKSYGAVIGWGLAAALTPLDARAAPTAEPAQMLAQAADCYAVGSRVAAANGGQLVQATAEARGGQTVCRVVIVIPGGSGERPKRAEFVVPAN